MMTTTNTRTNKKPTMIPAIQPPVHPPCVEDVPGDEVVWSLVVGDVVGGRVEAIVVAIRMICGIKRACRVKYHKNILSVTVLYKTFYLPKATIIITVGVQFYLGLLLKIGHSSTYGELQLRNLPQKVPLHLSCHCDAQLELCRCN